MSCALLSLCLARSCGTAQLSDPFVPSHPHSPASAVSVAVALDAIEAADGPPVRNGWNPLPEVHMRVGTLHLIIVSGYMQLPVGAGHSPCPQPCVPVPVVPPPIPRLHFQQCDHVLAPRSTICPLPFSASFAGTPSTHQHFGAGPVLLFPETLNGAPKEIPGAWWQPNRPTPWGLAADHVRCRSLPSPSLGTCGQHG